MKFFPLDFENKFYCFFDIGECCFPGLTLADRAGDFDALDSEAAFFLRLKHYRIFHKYTLFPETIHFFSVSGTECFGHLIASHRLDHIADNLQFYPVHHCPRMVWLNPTDPCADLAHTKSPELSLDRSVTLVKPPVFAF